MLAGAGVAGATASPVPPDPVAAEASATELVPANETLADGAAESGSTVEAMSVSPGQVLSVGQSDWSGNRAFRLVMQGDGNLVLVGPGGAVWASGTAGSGADRAVLQPDGNLVLLRGGTPVWSTGTYGIAARATLLIQDDGNLVLVAGNGPVWSIRTGRLSRTASIQPAGAGLTVGQSLASPNGAYWTAMQADGNLVAYGPGGAYWQSGTRGTNGMTMLQTDGNLVVTRTGQPIWHTNTGGRGPATHLTLQNDGNLVAYTPGNGAIWSIHTGATGRVATGLNLGQTLSAGMFLTSSNRAYWAVQQGDGNLVIYGPTGPVWQSGTRGTGSYLTLQGDGNLVLVASGAPRWHTYTNGFGGNRLVLQDDGNLVLYAGTRPLWSSRTGGLVGPLYLTRDRIGPYAANANMNTLVEQISNHVGRRPTSDSTYASVYSCSAPGTIGLQRRVSWGDFAIYGDGTTSSSLQVYAWEVSGSNLPVMMNASRPFYLGESMARVAQLTGLANNYFWVGPVDGYYWVSEDAEFVDGFSNYHFSCAYFV